MLTASQAECFAKQQSPISNNSLPRKIRFPFSGVYVFWTSNGKALYVGYSVNVFRRAYDRGNPAGREKAFKELHSIEFFRCDSPEQARHLESELISIYEPRYNKTNIYQGSKTFRQLQAAHERLFGGRSL